MRRPNTPSSPSPFGDTIFATFGGKKKTPVQGVSEAWTNLAPITPRGSPDAGQLGPRSNSPYDPPSDEEVEIPDMYRAAPAGTIGKPLLPDYELWIGLKGGNGPWQKRKAVTEWRQQLADHQETEATRMAELKWAQKAKKEAEEKRRLDREELQRRVEEDEISRRRRAVAEEEQRHRAKMEQEEQERILAEKRDRMHKSRPCKICCGSGKCPSCHGKGCNLTLYLAPVVNERTKSICGQLPRGCSACGGSGDGAWWGEFMCGSGSCQSCCGKGQVPAPPNGWPDCQ